MESVSCVLPSFSNRFLLLDNLQLELVFVPVLVKHMQIEVGNMVKSRHAVAIMVCEILSFIKLFYVTKDVAAHHNKNSDIHSGG